MAILINTIQVVGVTYDARQQRIAALEEGAFVFFKAEPHNKYDPQAVAVLNENGEHLGYVGRNDPKREQIRCALANGFVIARALKVGGYKKWDGTRATYGLRVQFYTVNWMYGFANVEGKDDDDDELVPVKSSGKHPTNRYELNKQHKIDDLRVLVMTSNNPRRTKQYKRILTHKNRRKFNACIDSVDKWNEYTSFTEDAFVQYHFDRYNKRMRSKVSDEELEAMERKLGIVTISA